MSVIITYGGRISKFMEAVKLANNILVDVAFYDIITSRKPPFDESRPRDLSPVIIAELFGSVDLDLTLREYKRPSSIGGAFDPDYPHIIWGNINATHRSECNLASMLVHECVHALSFHVKEYDFSHDQDTPSRNQQTAPYWIGNRVRRHYCNLKDVDLNEKEPLIVELQVNDKDIVN